MAIQTESRKGQECPFKPILCQEGFCGECFIYQSHLTKQGECAMLNKKGKANATNRRAKKDTNK